MISRRTIILVVLAVGLSIPGLRGMWLQHVQCERDEDIDQDPDSRLVLPELPNKPHLVRVQSEAAESTKQLPPCQAIGVVPEAVNLAAFAVWVASAASLMVDIQGWWTRRRKKRRRSSASSTGRLGESRDHGQPHKDR